MNVLIAALGLLTVTLSNPVQVTVPLGTYSFGPGVNYGGQYRLESQSPDGSITGQYGYQTQDRHVKVTYSSSNTQQTSKGEEVITDVNNNQNNEFSTTNKETEAETSTSNTTDIAEGATDVPSSVSSSGTEVATESQALQPTHSLNVPFTYAGRHPFFPHHTGTANTQRYLVPSAAHHGLQTLSSQYKPHFTDQQVIFNRPQAILTRAGQPIFNRVYGAPYANFAPNVQYSGIPQVYYARTGQSSTRVGSSQVPPQFRIPYTGNQRIPLASAIHRRPVVGGQTPNIYLSPTHSIRGTVGLQTIYSQRPSSATGGSSGRQQSYARY